MIEVYCRNNGQYIDVDGGETLAHILSRIEPALGFTPICALVNYENRGLDLNVYRPLTVEFLPRTSPAGHRVYVRSLCMIMYMAVRRLWPDARLRIEHSISSGYYCRITGGGFSNQPADIDLLHRTMRAIVDADVPFERHTVMTARAIDIFTDEGLHDKVELLRTTRRLYTTYYSLDCRLDGSDAPLRVNDSYYGCLALSTGVIDVFDVKPYKEGVLLLGFDPANVNVPPQPITQQKMYRAFTDYLAFNAIVGVSNVGELNREVIDGNSARLINVAEALHEKAIARISDHITDRYHNGGARIVLIAGPSSSGKTTTTKRLAIQLMTNLLKPQMISLDDYFVNRDQTPRDESGDYDYESLYALDLEQFNSDLNRILKGEEVELPTYDFTTGTRRYQGNRIKLSEGSILLIEGIHGLNPELTSHIDDRMKYRVYVSALTTLSIDDHNWVPTTDNRLLRRIIRDSKFRGISAEETIRRWPSVRRGEERWIFPYQENADATFNSSLLFELGVMRDYADNLLARVPDDIPEHAEAHRLRTFLSYFLPISSDLIPPTSLLREFLGGSSFHY